MSDSDGEMEWGTVYRINRKKLAEYEKVLKEGLKEFILEVCNFAEEVKKELKFSIREDSYMEWTDDQIKEIERIVDVVVDSVLNPEAYE